MTKKKYDAAVKLFRDHAKKNKINFRFVKSIDRIYVAYFSPSNRYIRVAKNMCGSYSETLYVIAHEFGHAEDHDTMSKSDVKLQNAARKVISLSLSLGMEIDKKIEKAILNNEKMANSLGEKLLKKLGVNLKKTNILCYRKNSINGYLNLFKMLKDYNADK